MVPPSNSARSRIATSPIPGLRGSRDAAFAVVFHFEFQRLAQKSQTHPGFARPGMAGNIIQSFLQDPINMDGGVAVDRKRVRRISHSLCESRLLSTTGRYQSSVLSRPASSSMTGCSAWERLRTLFERGLRDFAYFAQVGAQGEPSGACFSGAAQHGADGGQNLAEFIMQFARNVAQRGFLRGNQFLRQFAALLRTTPRVARTVGDWNESGKGW